ncbi:MAG: hypothetical protein V3U36_04725 [Anaerolineales bacterium]
MAADIQTIFMLADRAQVETQLRGLLRFMHKVLPNLLIGWKTTFRKA